MNETYTVKKGDTLYGISNQFGVSVTELANLNNVKADTLKVGMILKIPIKEGTNPNNMFMYTVKKGDTLYTIAKKYNTTVAKIVDLNNLTNTNLEIGQVLRIPETYTKEEEMYLPNYITYTVKKGDTLYSVASANNISVDTLMKDNGITDNKLSIGQTLKIRIPSNSQIIIEECFGEEYIPPVDSQSTLTYTVKKGDNLYNIAKQYNTTINDIITLNNLTSNNLTIGKVLNIPTSKPNSSNSLVTYTVKKGDTLYTIAREYNTTVDNIKNKNNLKTNTLTIGQKLII